MTKPPILILGARSDIGRAIAHRFAAEGHPVQLAARAPEALEADRADIALRHGVEVSCHAFDALDHAGHDRFLDGLPELPGIAACVVGLMGEQEENARDMDAARLVMRSNYEGPAEILARLANRFEARGSGTLIGVSSVAGERGRASNYVYGSAKAGFTAFLSGLRNRLSRTPVRVITVLPGFVATRMTENMDLPAPLTAAPQEVAEAVWRAHAGARDVVYVRRIWALIMAVIRAIPEPVFKKTRL
ncbi:MAG: SDR family oxidoreductase [Paracoccaceae bacterium]